MDDYDVGIASSVAHSGSRSGYIFARPEPRGFGTLMQKFRPDRFRGSRLRLSAFVRTVGVEQRAGLWMRIDRPDGARLGFDNMKDRPIVGTRDWHRYHHR